MTNLSQKFSTQPFGTVIRFVTLALFLTLFGASSAAKLAKSSLDGLGNGLYSIP